METTNHGPARSPDDRTNGRWGLSFPLNGVPLWAHREVLAEAESLGYTDGWTPEVAGSDGFVPIGVAAAVTTHMRLGTAIANVFTRGPALLAMTAATAAEAAPGRFCLGVGVGSHAIVESWNGLELKRPMQRLRETIVFLRATLAGEKASNESLGVGGFRLTRTFTAAPPIFVAALREKMLSLAGTLGDGILINFLSPSDVTKVVSVASRAAEDAGRDPQRLEVVCVLPVLAGGREKASRAYARRMSAAYLSTPVYGAFQAWLGRGDSLRPMTDAWNAGDRLAAVELVPEDVIDDLFVIGDPKRCLDKIESYCQAGVTTPVLSFVSAAEEPDEVGRQAQWMMRQLARH